MTSWTKVKPWDETIHQGCLNCPPVTQVAPLDMLIAVGFGDAHVSKDGVNIYREDPNSPNDNPRTLAEFEEVAKEDPDHDWRVVLFAPLRGREYQRQDGKWVLIDSNEGFA